MAIEAMRYHCQHAHLPMSRRQDRAVMALVHLRVQLGPVIFGYRLLNVFVLLKPAKKLFTTGIVLLVAPGAEQV